MYNRGIEVKNMKLLLICGAGMSSSLLSNKVNEAITKRNLDIEAWAIPSVDIKLNIDKADVVLLAPQIRFMLKQFADLLGETPIQVIDFQVYGSMNGDKIVDQGIKIYEEYAKK